MNNTKLEDTRLARELQTRSQTLATDVVRVLGFSNSDHGSKDLRKESV